MTLKEKEERRMRLYRTSDNVTTAQEGEKRDRISSFAFLSRHGQVRRSDDSFINHISFKSECRRGRHCKRG
jgi:hypothetical protein